jgi:hypothetical protein
MRDFIRYLFTPDNRGVGTSNLAYERNQTPPIYSLYGPRYNVQKTLAPTAGARMKLAQDVPIVSIEGNGSFMQGQMALQALVDTAAEQAKKGAAK